MRESVATVPVRQVDPNVATEGYVDRHGRYPMKIKPVCLLAALALSTIDLSGAAAFPPYAYGPGPFGYRYAFRPYGYTFRPYGYGFRPYGFRRGLSNGTGYRGRGTFTGGPVGGLPNRN